MSNDDIQQLGVLDDSEGRAVNERIIRMPEAVFEEHEERELQRRIDELNAEVEEILRQEYERRCLELAAVELYDAGVED